MHYLQINVRPARSSSVAGGCIFALGSFATEADNSAYRLTSDFSPFATEVMRRRNMSQLATCCRKNVQQMVAYSISPEAVILGGSDL